jgi:serine/threonine protein kinase
MTDALGTTDDVRASAGTDGSHPGSDTPVGDLPAVPGYRVLREIARGGMGRVLGAYDLTLDRDVALKILLPGANADRFVRESKITGCADLTLRTKQLESGDRAARAQVQQMLKHWQQDSDFVGIRDKAALEKLPPDEQKACTQFWADVAALLKKAEEKAR